MYFQKIKDLDGSVRENCVACIECSRTIKTKTRNTTNLLSHLKIKHPTSMLMLRRKQKKRNKLLRGLLKLH